MRSVPRQPVKHPYDLLFGDEEHTAFISLFSGTFSGPLELPDGTVIEPTGKPLRSSSPPSPCGRTPKILEEHILHDNASLMQQIGLASHERTHHAWPAVAAAVVG